MFSANLNPHLDQVHRQHLWTRLRQRLTAAQGNSALLDLLTREAESLGFDVSADSDILPSPLSPVVAPQDRLTRTLQALAHIRVEHDAPTSSPPHRLAQTLQALSHIRVEH